MTHPLCIVPALIPRSLEHVCASARTLSMFAREIQIDVVDGVFVGSVSWPYGTGEQCGEPSEVGTLSKTLDIEFDLMVASPDVELQRYISAQPKRIIVHMDAKPDVIPLGVRVRDAGACFGVAATNDTPLALFLEALRHADYAQCMGITPVGAQGRPFDTRTLERVRAVRAAFPHMEIAVDGSVNAETIPLLRDAGATRFVSGSAILGASDPAAAYAGLSALIEKNAESGT